MQKRHEAGGKTNTQGDQTLQKRNQESDRHASWGGRGSKRTPAATCHVHRGRTGHSSIGRKRSPEAWDKAEVTPVCLPRRGGTFSLGPNQDRERGGLRTFRGGKRVWGVTGGKRSKASSLTSLQVNAGGSACVGRRGGRGKTSAVESGGRKWGANRRAKTEG